MQEWTEGELVADWADALQPILLHWSQGLGLDVRRCFVLLMCSYGSPWLRKHPSRPGGFTRGPNHLSSASSQVDQCLLLLLLLQRGSGFFPLPLSSLHFHLVICFHSLIYREQESFVGRWIPSDIILWISIRRINSGSVCGIRPHYKLIHQHQPGQYIIHRNFITFVCSGKEKVKEWKSEIRPIFHEELSRRCSEVFFYKHYLQWRMLHPENVIKSQGFIKCFHTYCIHSLGMVPTAFSLLLSGFIRKVWLLSSVCALIPSIQGEWKCPCCLNLQLFPL